LVVRYEHARFDRRELRRIADFMNMNATDTEGDAWGQVREHETARSRGVVVQRSIRAVMSIRIRSNAPRQGGGSGLFRRCRGCGDREFIDKTLDPRFGYGSGATLANESR
jgi:hypothetical protein